MSIAPVRARDVVPLLDALTAELAGEGYTAEQSFGYSIAQLEASGVHLVAASVSGAAVGVGGVEVTGSVAELKRFYVVPSSRGTGVADAIMLELLSYARSHGVQMMRLETGDKQSAARRYYARHGFREVPRFPPYEGSETSVCMQRSLG